MDGIRNQNNGIFVSPFSTIFTFCFKYFLHFRKRYKYGAFTIGSSVNANTSISQVEFENIEISILKLFYKRTLLSIPNQFHHRRKMAFEQSQSHSYYSYDFQEPAALFSFEVCITASVQCTVYIVHILSFKI